MSTKITDDELKRLELIKQDALEIASVLGELNYQKTVLQIQIEDQTTKIKEIKLREQSLFNDLQEKYGNVSINITTGEFQ
jgi:catalase (peroxidase I)